MTPDTSPASREPSRAPSSDDTTSRVLDALQRSAARARRVAAQTGTRLVVVRNGELVIEPVETETAEVSKSEAAPPTESSTDL